MASGAPRPQPGASQRGAGAGSPEPANPERPPSPAAPEKPQVPPAKCRALSTSWRPCPDAALGPQPAGQPSQERRWPMPCDWRGFMDQGRVVAHLDLALGRETRLWRGWRTPGTDPRVGALAGVRAFTPSARPREADGLHLHALWAQQVEIRSAFQEVVLWLLRLDNIFGFSGATFNLALTVISRLLASRKIKERYLKCITITSLRLAAKVNEEEELIPRVKDFIKHYGSAYTPNELLRMELAILDVLQWDLYIGTPLDFLTIVSTRSLCLWISCSQHRTAKPRRAHVFAHAPQ
nr:cyclin-I2 [Dasypus novemcinctus]